jgi:hypothetical protein
MRPSSTSSSRLRSCYGPRVLITDSGWSQWPVAGSMQFCAALVACVSQGDEIATIRVTLRVRSARCLERAVLPSEHEPAGNPLR